MDTRASSKATWPNTGLTSSGFSVCGTTPLGRARTNSISIPSASNSPWSLAISQGRLNTVPLISLTTFFISAVSFDALFEAVHHPAKAPAMAIDVLVHAVAVERLLLHKHPRRIHIRHVEEEHTAYGLLAIVGNQWSTRHHHAGMLGEVRLVGRTELLAQGSGSWLVKTMKHGLDMAFGARTIPPGVRAPGQPAMDIPTLLHATHDIGFLCHMALGSGAVGKFDQTQAAQVGRLVIRREGAGKQGLCIEHFEIVKMRLTVLVTQRCRVWLVVDQDRKMHGCFVLPRVA